MQELEVFYKRIEPHAQGAAYPVIADAILKAAEEFCERTRLWRGPDQITLSDNQTEYICAPTYSTIFEIESAVNSQGRKLTPTSLSELRHQYDDWQGLTGEAPVMYTQTAPDTIRFVPHASEGSVTLDLFLKPSPHARQLPDFLFNQYSRVIADGALSQLLLMPGQSYTNPDLATYYMRSFDSALDRLNRQSIKGQQRAPTRTQASFF